MIIKDNTIIFSSGSDSFFLEIPKNFNKILVQMSGGVNSALMAYALAQYKSLIRPEISITPVTMLINDTPFDVHYAKHIVEIVEFLCNTKFEKMQATVSNQIQFKESLDVFTKNIYKYQGADAHFIGLNKNDYQTGYFKQNKTTSAFYPLVQLDKRQIAGFFESYDLHKLYQHTTSCKNRTSEHNHHCGECHKCKQRIECFGELETEDNIGRYIDLPRGIARDWSDC